MSPSSIQSDNFIESFPVYELQTDRQTDRRFRKNRFFWLRGSQNVKIWWKFRKSFFIWNQHLLISWECKNLWNQTKFDTWNLTTNYCSTVFQLLLIFPVSLWFRIISNYWGHMICYHMSEFNVRIFTSTIMNIFQQNESIDLCVHETEANVLALLKRCYYWRREHY